jgi:hypothetical protein
MKIFEIGPKLKELTVSPVRAAGRARYPGFDGG